MIAREENPDFLNAFLDYSTTTLNKSPNSIKEYNYDLAMFLKFIKVHFNMTDKVDFNEINIDKKSELFFLLTRMQDEVHRYAISFHKNVRSKSLFQSILDDVEGIGPKRKKELLKHFGSVKKLKEATIEQLEEVLPKEVAKNLFTVLQNTK